MTMTFIDVLLGRWMKRNSSRDRLALEIKQFAEMIPEAAMVLDAGAGDEPYKPLVAHTRYESADFRRSNKPDVKTTYVCDLKSIPVEDHRYDFILFNQVMEHLPEPDLVLLELFRVLKPGGKLLYTAPLFFEEHLQPYDFYRYTQYGVRMLFERAGFTLERLDWMEGYYATVAYQLNRMARYLPGRPSEIAPGLLGYLMMPLFVVVRVQMALLSIGFHWLEMKRKFTRRGYPKNYIAIARRGDAR
jgi:SAM-dependent methyltransferase